MEPQNVRLTDSEGHVLNLEHIVKGLQGWEQAQLFTIIAFGTAILTFIVLGVVVFLYRSR